MFLKWIDYVFIGEVDNSFLEWLNVYNEGEFNRLVLGIVSSY